MKAARLRIIDLIDQHGDTFEECGGCPTCSEIERLRKSMERTPEKKFAHILAKGQDMKRADIELLIESGVMKKAIREAWGMPKNQFWELLQDWGFEIRKGMGNVSAMIEQYKTLKAKGLTDYKIAKELNISSATLSQRKKKWFNEAEKPKLAIVEPKQGDNSPKDKTAKYRALIAKLDGQVKSSKEQETKLAERIRQLEESHSHINAACEDLEKESIKLQEENNKLKADKKIQLDELLDTRDKLVRQDYTLENQKKALENARTTLERYEKENKAMRGLLECWI